MFEALVVVCVSMTRQECAVIEDTRGPYTTARECADRVVEMSADILKIDSKYVIPTGRCEPVEDPQHRFPMTERNNNVKKIGQRNGRGKNFEIA